MATKKPSRILFVILAVVVIVAAGIGAAVLYEYQKPKGTSSALTVHVGDNVTVNYIGKFASGPQEGRVFDTSFLSVARNNASYPKSLEYTPRSSASAYTPLGVYVGSNAPSSGYTIGNLTFSTVVTGFWQGLVGLPGNRTETIAVPPNLGYGSLNSSCLHTGQLVRTAPTTTFIPRGQFSTLYPNASLQVGAVFSDSTYGWNDTIYAVNATTVTVQALAVVGTLASPQGLPYVVTSVNATSIVLSSQLTPANYGSYLGHATTGGLCGKTQFLVNSIDLASGTFVENFNPEVQGQTLDFVVTVVNIYPA